MGRSESVVAISKVNRKASRRQLHRWLDLPTSRKAPELWGQKQSDQEPDRDAADTGLYKEETVVSVFRKLR